MNERSLLKRFKVAKKELRGLKVALIINLFVSITYWYLRGNSIDYIHSISIARERKRHKRLFKGPKKEFRWSKVLSKCIIFPPGKY